MSTTLAEIKGRECNCGDYVEGIYVDYLDCGGNGLTLKRHYMGREIESESIDIPDGMIADLVDILIEYQNRGLVDDS